ncbi:PREDICTED: uncharacterized protein LOC109487337 [Branchiostoma belcheri]|uniref:Uncharacterized protein LOC109487337 n=1 Tax=Branchiostoma belcheri TaxID=7741 RepID=A0A6P5A0K8_BRABE|nr:PREDICTED: uncharacterized protein LOC109487337 [Branchiostoma belcheri]
MADYVSFDGVCYKDFVSLRTYDEARQRCAVDGGLLAMPTDDATNTFIAGLRDGLRWFGLTDEVTEGVWVFEDGRPLTSTGYSSWAQGEPNDHLVSHQTEDCAVYSVTEDGSVWFDIPCSRDYGFICQEELYVASSIYITGVGFLSEKHGNISISLEYSLSWVDGRLAGLTESWVPVPSNSIWSPPVAFGRSVRRAIATSEGENWMWFDPRGLVVLKISRQLSVNCVTHLAMYPLDTQVCTVALHGYNGVKLRLQPSANINAAPVKSDATGVVSQFTLVGVEARTMVQSFVNTGCISFEQMCDYHSEPCMTSLPDCTKETCGDCSTIVGKCSHKLHFCDDNFNDTDSFNVLEVHIHMRRILWRYVLNAYFPSVVIVASSYLQTWLPVTQCDVTARVTLGAMAILSLIKQWEETERMPWVEEPRAIDVWMLGCLAFVIAFLLETSVMHFVSSYIQEKEQQAIRSEQRARELNPPLQIPRPGLRDPTSGSNTTRPQPPNTTSTRPQPRNAATAGEPVYIPRARMHTPGYLRWHQVKDKEWVVVIKSEKNTQNNAAAPEASPKTNGDGVANNHSKKSEEDAVVSYTPDPLMVNSAYDRVEFNARAFEPSAKDRADRLATKIDSFARVVFPLGFVIFNAAYWGTYRHGNMENIYVGFFCKVFLCLCVFALTASTICTNDYMELAIPEEELTDIDQNNLHWEPDQNCGATTNGTHYLFRTDLYGCGTQVAFDPTSVIFLNTINIRGSHEPDDVITRKGDIRITSKCEYERQRWVYATFLPIPGGLNFTEEGFGQLKILFTMFPTRQYQTPYQADEFPVHRNLGEQIYLQLKVEGHGQELSVLALNCKATMSPEPNDTLQYQLINEGCASDQTVDIYSIEDPAVEQFSFEAFRFIQEVKMVYVHCEVMVCDAADPGSRCAQGCVTRRKRASDEKVDMIGRHMIYLGPIILDEEESGISPSSASRAMLAAGGGLMAASVVVTGSVILAKRLGFTCGRLGYQGLSG